MSKDMAKFLASLVLFGSNGVVAAQIGLPSYEIVVLRTLLGSLLLGGLLLIRRKRRKAMDSRWGFVLVALSGVFMGISWMLLFEAYTQIGVGPSSLVYYCGPIIVMALSPLLFKERLTAMKLVGFGVVLAGIVAVNGFGAYGAMRLGGVSLAALSAVFFAAMVVANKKADGVGGLERSFIQVVFAFATSAAATGMIHGFEMSVQPGDIGPILVLGLVNTGLGCYLYFSSFANLKAQTVSACGYLEPVSAVVLSAVLLDETLSPIQITGAIVVIGGAALCELAPGFAQRKTLPA